MTHNMRILTVLAGLLLLVVGGTGCSTFDRDYQTALGGSMAGTVEGPWVGQWESHAGHGSGQLRALISWKTRDVLLARFRAQFWGIFHSENEVELGVQSTGPVKVSGQQDLGYLAGGVYQYMATITPEKFEATYECKWDKGVFRMGRPGKE